MNALPLIRRLLTDQDGIAATELALVAPFLAILVIGASDMGNGFSRKLALEQAAQRAIEKVMQTTGVETPDATLKAEAVAQAGGGLTVEDVTINYTLFCDNAVEPNYDTECAPTAVQARYVEVVIRDEFEPLFPAAFPANVVDGKYPIEVTAGMRIQ